VESDQFIDAAQHALWVLALGSAPLLIPTLIVGVLLGMVQAATSINEATLSFVPKLIVCGICLAVFGGAIMMLMVDLTQDMYARIPELVR
jgi:flagellar biosynthesis protein FliQ